MNKLPTLLGTALNRAKVLAQGRPRCLKLVRSLISGKRVSRLGGRAQYFVGYITCPSTSMFCHSTTVIFLRTQNGRRTHRITASVNGSRGRTYFCEGSDLSAISDSYYDFLLSTHNLEHLAKSYKGLERVAASGKARRKTCDRPATLCQDLRPPKSANHTTAHDRGLRERHR